ncbi:MAG: type II toxin-antitoxin system VapC family toxin [Gemmatimonadaceae bacterium]|nr:type II toxin-antitoxin system VapC family toxin [Gemmatimonadaceae bacterium]
MIVPDVNLLLYATNSSMPQHARAKRWMDDLFNGDEPIGFSWLVLVGFVRIATNPRVYRAPLTVHEALEVVDGWLSQRLVSIIEPTSAHWEILRSLLRESGTAANLTNDANLAALCIERGATLHSADGDFTRFRGLRWENPLLSY